MNDILTQLAQPFHPSRIFWRPGATTSKKDKALALAYADARAYQSRLDAVCGLDWSVTYTPWGDRIICHLTIAGITRSSTGEADSDSERNETAGTSAESQAFKRACAMFGLGRYLYTLPQNWVEFDAANSRFTEQGKAKLMGTITQHYQRTMAAAPGALAEDPIELAEPAEPAQAAQAPAQATPPDARAKLLAKLDAKGVALYGEQWPNVRAHNIKRLLGDGGGELSADQIQTLINGLIKLERQRAAA